MSTRLQWASLKVLRRLWFRATAFSFIAAAVALGATAVHPEVPAELAARIGADAVGDLLNVIAASMLSVTIFSLSTVVAAQASATSSATPRATQLLSEDNTSQNALGTFVGSFIFSLIGIVALQTGTYGEQGRVALYVVTLVVIAIVVVTLLRWIDHVSTLGRVGEITARVETATARVMRTHASKPHLDGAPLAHDRGPPAGAQLLHPDRAGYVQNIDVAALDQAARAAGIQVFVTALPGAYADPGHPLAWLSGPEAGDDTSAELRKAFSVGESRSFDQDPRYGMAVLSEIASRALSPAVNDPGTAINVLARAGRVLALWAEEPPQPPSIRYPNVHVPPVRLEDLFDDLFTPIARDGAGMVEVGLRLQRVLAGLARLGDDYRQVATAHAARALARAEAALTFEEDLARVRDAARELVAR